MAKRTSLKPKNKVKKSLLNIDLANNMKFINRLLFVITIALLVGCAKSATQTTSTRSTTYERNGMVNFSGYSKNVLTVASEHSAENLSKAIYFAEVNALENILFRGIPNSPSESPIIADEVSAMKNNKMILDTFIFETGIKTFVTNSQTISHNKQGDRIFVKQNVSFDLNGIRKF